MPDKVVSDISSERTAPEQGDWLYVTEGSTDYKIKYVMLRRRRVNAQTGTTYTPVAADAIKRVTLDNGAPITVTIDASVFEEGDELLLQQIGAGQVSVVAGSGVTLNVPNAFEAKSAERYSIMRLHFDSASVCSLEEQGLELA